MRFYKVKPEADQVHTGTRTKYTGTLIANELYTAKEIAKRQISPEKVAKHMDSVEISRKGTFWMFGARFTKSVNLQNSGK